MRSNRSRTIHPALRFGILLLAVCPAGILPAESDIANCADSSSLEPKPPQPGSDGSLGDRWREGWRHLGEDGRYLLTFARRPTRRGAAGTAAVVAGVGALILLDDEIRVEVQEERTRGLDRWERRIEPLGHIRNTTAAAFGVYGIGRVSRSERIAETGRTLLEALLFTEGIDAAAKGVFGRKEPGEGTRASDFFAGSSFFPSGHTARAFAFATVLAERHGRPAAVPAYGLAGLVGLSRIERDVHWASDVLAGAALGHVAARAIVERRAGREKPPRRVELHPALSFDGNRFELRLAFRRADPSASEDWR